MELQGIIHQSKSSWSSLLHMLEKSDSSWRQLPAAEPGHQAGHVPTTPHGGPLGPAGSKKVFSKLDLWKGYYQVPVALQDAPKTVDITPFGLR